MNDLSRNLKWRVIEINFNIDFGINFNIIFGIDYNIILTHKTEQNVETLLVHWFN